MVFHQSGDAFQQPWTALVVYGTGTELLDQKHDIALWVIGKHAYRAGNAKQFPIELPAPGTVEPAMPEPELLEAEEPLRRDAAVNDLKIAFRVERRCFRHGG